jgi:succinate dehydrogenase / fumarate reductase cytochrome b subunit
VIAVVDMWRSTVGKKVFVAVTGAILIGYLILHMAGNLNSLFGPGGGNPRVDWYGDWLRNFGQPLVPYEFVLWLVRGVLLGALVVHVAGVIQLFRRNRAARPSAHPSKRIGRSWESQFMMVTGTLVLAFVVFHILQFTTLTIDVTPLHHGEIYANLYNAFQEWYFVVLYVIATALICFHLRHGIWGVGLTLGFANPANNRQIRHGVNAFVLVLFAGFVAPVILFYADVLDAPAAHATLTALSGGQFQ